MILCTTRPSSKLLGSGRRRRAVRKDYVTLIIDGARLYSSEPYEYKEDSEVSSIVPKQTIHNGGTNISVIGTNLHIIQHPKVGVKLDGNEVQDVRI